MATLWMRLKRRYKHYVKHADTPIHPVAMYAIIAVLIIATLALVGYTITTASY